MLGGRSKRACKKTLLLAGARFNPQFYGWSKCNKQSRWRRVGKRFVKIAGAIGAIKNARKQKLLKWGYRCFLKEDWGWWLELKVTSQCSSGGYARYRKKVNIGGGKLHIWPLISILLLASLLSWSKTGAAFEQWRRILFSFVCSM